MLRKMSILRHTFSPQPQSRQSAKLFLKSSEMGLPQPLTRRRVCPPPPPVLGGGAQCALAGERGVGRVPIPTKGHTLWYHVWYSIYIRTLFVPPPLPSPFLELFLFLLVVQFLNDWGNIRQHSSALVVVGVESWTSESTMR
jgi:hypothetical protein